MNKSLNGLPQ